MGCLIHGSLTSTQTLSLLLYVLSVTTVISSGPTTDGGLLPTGTQEDDKPKGDLEAQRLNTAAVQTRLRNLSVAAEKVAPLTVSSDGSSGVAVDVIVAVMSVLGINDAEKTMTSNLFIRVSWTDTALSWNSSEYKGVDTVKMAASAIWTPGVYIVNSPDKRWLIEDTSLVVINSDGSLNARVDLVVETLCDMDLSRYPYDTQNCSLVFSRMYPSPLTMRVNGFISPRWSSILTYNGEWAMEAAYSKDLSFLGGEVPYMTVQLRRKTVFYTACVVLPMVLTSFMNTLVFLVPVQSGEKISYLVSIFVSTSVFTSFFTSVMPRGLDMVPSTIKLLIGVIVESFVVLLATLFVIARETAHADTASGGESRHGRAGVVDSDIARLPMAAFPAEPVRDTPSKGNPAPDNIFVSTETYSQPAYISHISATEQVPTGYIRMTTLCLDRTLFLLALVANITFLVSVFFEYM